MYDSQVGVFACLLFSIPTVLSKEYVRFVPDIIIEKKAIAHVDSHSYIPVIAGGSVALMAVLLVSIFIYQRKKSQRSPLTNIYDGEYIPKSSPIPTKESGKHSILANGIKNGFLTRSSARNGGILKGGYGASSEDDETAGNLDARLSQSAHLYQYQHAKQQMLSLQKQMSVLKDNDDEEDGEYNNEEESTDEEMFKKGNNPPKIKTLKSGGSGNTTVVNSDDLSDFESQQHQTGNHGIKHINNIKDDTFNRRTRVDSGGDYTVYECPGLASASEMEVKNPLFKASVIHDNYSSQGSLQ